MARVGLGLFGVICEAYLHAATLQVCHASVHPGIYFNMLESPNIKLIAKEIYLTTIGKKLRRDQSDLRLPTKKIECGLILVILFLRLLHVYPLKASENYIWKLLWL